jgi:hypothetical protein
MTPPTEMHLCIKIKEDLECHFKFEPLNDFRQLPVVLSLTTRNPSTNSVLGMHLYFKTEDSFRMLF